MYSRVEYSSTRARPRMPSPNPNPNPSPDRCADRGRERTDAFCGAAGRARVRPRRRRAAPRAGLPRVPLAHPRARPRMLLAPHSNSSFPSPLFFVSFLLLMLSIFCIRSYHKCIGRCFSYSYSYYINTLYVPHACLSISTDACRTHARCTSSWTT